MNSELVQYILVNQDLTMSTGKIAAQVGHSCTVLTQRILTSDYRENFYEWYKQQKKIVLKAPQTLLEELEKRGYIAIRDKGYTEIEPNSLTVVTLGITTRDEAAPIVGQLPLLK